MGKTKLGLFAVVTPGLEETACQEIEELVHAKAVVTPSVVICAVDTPEKVCMLAFRAQSLRRLLLSIGTFSTDEFDLASSHFPWDHYFSSGISFKVEVEQVQGQENRFALARQVVGKIFSILEAKKIMPIVDLKKPALTVIVIHNGEKYYLGLDVMGREINQRHYRIFPHSASTKGDLAYHFIRQSGFNTSAKTIIGFAKDGTLAIEAALFAYSLPVQDMKDKTYSFYLFPYFKTTNIIGLFPPVAPPSVHPLYAFDPSRQNYTAALKNAKLAGVSSFLHISKYSLDELDVKFQPAEISLLLLHTTTKDEAQLNEMYHQARYVLRSKGHLFIIGRLSWDLSIASEFVLLQSDEVYKGGSGYKWWHLQKK